MKQRVLVLSFQGYDFKADNGQQLQGLKVTYVYDDPTAQPANDPNRGGIAPSEATIPLSERPSLVAGAGWYDCEFGIEVKKVTRGNRQETMPALVPKRFLYVGPLQRPDDAPARASISTATNNGAAAPALAGMAAKP